MNRLGFLVLSVLSKNEAFDNVTAMTAKEIAETECFGYKDNTIYKKLAVFEKLQYVAPGYKEGRAKTFYITQKGKEVLKNP